MGWCWLLNGLLSPARIVQYLLRAVVVLIAIPFHESAHALASHLLGDDTAVRAGRLSMNPMHHFDPLGALCMLVGPPACRAHQAGQSDASGSSTDARPARRYHPPEDGWPVHERIHEMGSQSALPRHAADTARSAPETTVRSKANTTPLKFFSIIS